MRRLLVLLVFIAGCDSKRVYEDFQSIQDTWKQAESYSFDFEVSDISKPYNLIVHLKQDADFQFHNFYFQYRLLSMDGDSLLKESLEEVFFFDQKSGEPLGSGIGGSFDNQSTLLENFKFPGKGNYRIEFQQFMRVTALPHVNRIGFRLEYAGS